MWTDYRLVDYLQNKRVHTVQSFNAYIFNTHLIHDGFFFNNSFFTKSLSMQWVYRKQTRWLIITEIKHKAMNKQEVKEFNTAEIAKKWTDLQTSVQCPCWSANKNNTSLNRWAINDMYIICFHISIIHTVINKWKYSLNLMLVDEIVHVQSISLLH